jgi:hypothetical protein
MTLDSAVCQSKKCKRHSLYSRGRGICHAVPVSRLEAGIGHEKFRCDRCGQLWKIIPSRDGAYVTTVSV